MSETAPETPATPAAAPPAEPAPAPDTGPEKDPVAEAEKWKALARKHEERAKENASAAQRLKEFEDAQKSEQQRLEERAAQAERERDSLRTEALRYRIAAEHGVAAEDMDLLDGVADEDKLIAKAQRIAALRAAATPAPPPPNRQPTPGRPVEQLRPGATPSDGQSEDDALYAQLFPNG